MSASNEVPSEGLAERVAAACERSGVPDARRIVVHANGGDVVLCGTVHHWADRARVARAAALVPGVTSVDNQIALVVEGKVEPPDTWTTAEWQGVRR